jgi:chitin disaccharide deacetylase
VSDSGPAQRRIVVAADDFGLSPAVDRGILTAYHEGVVRSTALMVNFPEVRSSVEKLRMAPGLEVGIHLNLTCGTPVSDARGVRSLVDRLGSFHLLSRFLPRYGCGAVRLDEVRREWAAQIEHGLGLGCQFAWVTSHQHVHMLPRLSRIVAELARKYGIPAVRNTRYYLPAVPWSLAPKAFAISQLGRSTATSFRKRGVFCNDLTFEVRANGGVAAAAASLRRTIRSLPPGTYELVSHPGFVDDELRQRDPRNTTGRIRELEVLTAPEAASVLRSGAELSTYTSLTSLALGADAPSFAR